MVIVTTKTSNDIAIDVVLNKEHQFVHTTEKFKVVKSEELTPSIIDLSKLGLVSYVELEDTSTKIEEPPRRRGRGATQENDESSDTKVNEEDEGGN